MALQKTVMVCRRALQTPDASTGTCREHAHHKHIHTVLHHLLLCLHALCRLRVSLVMLGSLHFHMLALNIQHTLSQSSCMLARVPCAVLSRHGF
jgi:hypothetical protein